MFFQEAVTLYLLLPIIGLLVFWVLNKHYHFGKKFVIKVEPLKIKILKGLPPKRFINEVKLISKHNRVRGFIFGIETDNNFTLKFSKGISSSNAQRIRNVFSFNTYSSLTPTTHNDPMKKRAR